MNMLNPEQYFPGQQSSEKVFLFIRRHWLVMLPEIIVGTVLAIFPMVLLIAFSLAGLAPFDPPARNFTVLLLPAFYLSLATWLFIRWLEYYLDIAMVTNERLVDVEQSSLFKRSISELNLTVVQDVSATRKGILETLFDFGDVMIQTAGDRENFLFRSIPHPNEMAQKIIGLQEAAIAQQRQEQSRGKQGAEEPEPKAEPAQAEVVTSSGETEAAQPKKPREFVPSGQAGGETPAKPTPSQSTQSPENNELPREYES